jgi:hypothetical protein
MSYPPADSQPHPAGTPAAYPPPAPGPGGPVGVPPKKSNVGKIVLIVLGVLVLLCVGGGVATYFLVKDEVKEVVEAVNTRVEAPETLAGRPKVTEPELQAAAAEMSEELKRDLPEATGSAAGFYGDLEEQDLLMLVAVSGIIADPAQELNDMVTDMTESFQMAELAKIEPGPLGGEARCGDGEAEGSPVAVCVWVDRGSLGLVVSYFQTSADLQKEFIDIRGAVEKRS